MHRPNPPLHSVPHPMAVPAPEPVFYGNSYEVPYIHPHVYESTVVHAAPYGGVTTLHRSPEGVAVVHSHVQGEKQE